MGTKLHSNSYEPPYKEIGKKIKSLRKSKFKTQDLFAEAIDVSVETVRNWEQGWTLAELGTFIRIAKILDCDLDYLLSDLECKTHDTQFIHDETGLSETAIKKMRSLNDAEKTLISDLIEHKDFIYLVRQLHDLKSKEYMSDTINNLQGELIKHQIGQRITGNKHSKIDSHLIEKAMLYSLSTQITNIICDITGTDLK
jgi:transcriptional regulator with XRE-family HTH domain